MTSLGSNQLPPVSVDHFYHVSELHARRRASLRLSSHWNLPIGYLGSIYSSLVQSWISQFPHAPIPEAVYNIPMKKTKQFLVNLIFDPEYNGYVADVPQLPECMSQGNTVEAALKNVRKAIMAYLKVAPRSFGIRRLGTASPDSPPW